MPNLIAEVIKNGGEQIAEALARGYCSQENSEKELDVALIKSMAEEVYPVFKSQSLALLRAVRENLPVEGCEEEIGKNEYRLEVYSLLKEAESEVEKI